MRVESAWVAAGISAVGLLMASQKSKKAPHVPGATECSARKASISPDAVSARRVTTHDSVTGELWGLSEDAKKQFQNAKTTVMDTATLNKNKRNVAPIVTLTEGGGGKKTGIVRIGGLNQATAFDAPKGSGVMHGPMPDSKLNAQGDHDFVANANTTFLPSM